MNFERTSGVFCHLTSLPGSHGIGDLGAGARDFLDFLDAADQSLWQFCPLGPTTGVHGHSPYSSPSTFAGNPLLLDLHALGDRGWLTDAELEAPDTAEPTHVDYEAVASFKRERLRTAFERFEQSADADASDAFEAFRERERDWLADYALYRALKRAHGGESWTEWPRELRERDPDALAAAREEHADEIRYHAFVQWRFDEQWRALREAARERGIQLLGDVPMYAALDSADVWANREAFAVDTAGDPEAVAGVPPSAGDDGQRWGMPVYDWDSLAADDYGWWVRRLDRLFDLVDVARLDHFKAFDAYWAIPADAASAADGEWHPGPGAAFFERVREDLGDLPFVVEDLGFLDDGVLGLRDRLGFPGMRVPEYADWCAEHHRYKPSDYPRDCVAYTSTHDTDTAAGYYESLDERQRDCFDYALDFERDGSPAWALLDAVWDSPAVVAMTTMPDLLGRGSDARLNTPGTATGNWGWRVEDGALTDDLAARLADVTANARR
ncbi:4-alpha-glucanotransferase [Halarchaeum grantii]|uniref:4-alpha-glucanotransferase n=1 Tax=Halarchaeum grantii TaxID=1193105 RepID=A0A830EWD3_9EURY|nr:4-alpha-glucanotransferase [Halarchaeum grantii]GGL37286.1 4-alpha-glucanotransferase [Halarchaeum grantii]